MTRPSICRFALIPLIFCTTSLAQTFDPSKPIEFFPGTKVVKKGVLAAEFVPAMIEGKPIFKAGTEITFEKTPDKNTELTATTVVPMRGTLAQDYRCIALDGPPIFKRDTVIAFAHYHDRFAIGNGGNVIEQHPILPLSGTLAVDFKIQTISGNPIFASGTEIEFQTAHSNPHLPGGLQENDTPAPFKGTLAAKYRFSSSLDDLQFAFAAGTKIEFGKFRNLPEPSGGANSNDIVEPTRGTLDAEFKQGNKVFPKGTEIVISPDRRVSKAP